MKTHRTLQNRSASLHYVQCHIASRRADVQAEIKRPCILIFILSNTLQSCVEAYDNVHNYILNYLMPR
jgi:hypothetical protein